MEYRIGALAPPLHEQIGSEPELIIIEQRAADSLNYLRTHGFLTKAESDPGVRRVLRSLEQKAISAGVLEPAGPDEPGNQDNQ